jgi:hypothetical protein
MYIRDLHNTNIPIFKCNSVIGNWLVREKSIPVLNKNKNVWSFSKTSLLEEILESMPLYLKALQIF